MEVHNSNRSNGEKRMEYKLLQKSCTSKLFLYYFPSKKLQSEVLRVSEWKRNAVLRLGNHSKVFHNISEKCIFENIFQWKGAIFHVFEWTIEFHCRRSFVSWMNSRFSGSIFCSNEWKKRICRPRFYLISNLVKFQLAISNTFQK